MVPVAGMLGSVRVHRVSVPPSLSPVTTQDSSERESTRDYAGEGIVVHWKAGLCLHSERCFGTLPEVFRPTQRPWIQVSEADADSVAAAVEMCPSGALTYTRTSSNQTSTSTSKGQDSMSERDDSDVTVITVTAGGPNMVSGQVEIRNDAGELVKTAKKVALCRCGASENKPFCDGSHNQVGFSDPGPSVD